MLQRKDIASIPYLKKNVFKGSYQGMRFWIRKKEDDDRVLIEAITWKEPFCYEKTPDEEKEHATFDFKEEALDDIVTWLNEQHRKIKAK